MRATLSMLSFDLRTLLRDHLLAMVAGLSAIFMVGFGIAGLYRVELGIEHWQPFVPYVLIMFLISNVATYGMLFGLVFVEEVETRARAALMVVPMNPAYQAGLRTVSVLIWLIVQPVLFAWVFSSGWDAVPFGFFEWLALCVALAPLGAVFMIILSTVASNRVEALAMGKFFSSATIPPMLLYLIQDDAWYRALFFVFPTTPAVYAFEAFRAEQSGYAFTWLLLGVAYALGLGVLVMRRFLRKSYGISA